MFDLKSISHEAIPRALEKAERYRLLNEPQVAESICRDVLRVDADNQAAIVTLILALTDQFGGTISIHMKATQELIPRLREEYERVYYTGIMFERQGKARLQQGTPGSGFDAHELLREAMSWFEKAEAIHPPGNDDAILRWNTCARMIMNDNLQPRQQDDFQPYLE
ncbi:MAG: hypothetical protein ACREOO_06125 [bacterium]